MQLEESYKRRKEQSPRRRSSQRSKPRTSDYDYLVLSRLSSDLLRLIQTLPDGCSQVALDIGSGLSPYRQFLEAKGYLVKSLDVDANTNADIIASVEDTKLASNSIGVVLCTQVLEHVSNPFAVACEIARIIKPGGMVICSVPHVWFFHPHPGDYFRFTNQGLSVIWEKAGLEIVEISAQGGSMLCFIQVFCFMVYGVLGEYGRPLFWILNVSATILDSLIKDNLFCVNFSCLARKRE